MPRIIARGEYYWLQNIVSHSPIHTYCSFSHHVSYGGTSAAVWHGRVVAVHKRWSSNNEASWSSAYAGILGKVVAFTEA
jgi:hypothetical protein